MQPNDTLVRADAPRVREALLHAGALDTAPTPALAKIAETEREKRKLEHAARLKRQVDIDAAGNIPAWIQAQLVAQGLAVSDDPATLTDAQKKSYKERKKAEATERRRLRRLAWESYHATHVNHLGSAVFYNDLVDIDKFDIERREERAKELGLPDWTSPPKLAAALGLSIARLRWLAFHKDVDTGSHYVRFTIPKRDGTARQITAPKPDLKRVQRFLLDNLLDRLTVHAAAHGFISNKSIQTNALVHAGADVVVKVDIKDFFPTITLPRVKGLLRKAGLPEQVATLVALLCTESPRDVVDFRGQTLYVATGARALPQGSPASPTITNALCLRLDKRMAGLGKKLGFAYTRYADDLTFSIKKASTTKQEAKAPAPIGSLLHGVRLVLAGEGFTLNAKKTTVMGGGTRQVVTGLIVNQRPDVKTSSSSPPVAATRVPREVVRKLRAAIHNRRRGKARDDESLAHLRGLAAFVFQSDPIKGRAFLDQLDALAPASTTSEA